VGAFAKVRGRVWESKDDSCSFLLTLVSRGMFWFIKEDTWHIMEGPGVKQKSEPLSGGRTLKSLENVDLCVRAAFDFRSASGLLFLLDESLQWGC
ncbi:hypothetical protein Ancab_019628, partial [Ancistrocladus abbreviatus]